MENTYTIAVVSGASPHTIGEGIDEKAVHSSLSDLVNDGAVYGEGVTVTRDRDGALMAMRYNELVVAADYEGEPYDPARSVKGWVSVEETDKAMAMRYEYESADPDDVEAIVEFDLSDDGVRYRRAAGCTMVENLGLWMELTEEQKLELEAVENRSGRWI